MINHSQRQLQQVQKERRRFIEEATHEQFIEKTKRKQYAPGSTFCWARMEVYGPIGSAEKREAAE